MWYIIGKISFFRKMKVDHKILIYEFFSLGVNHCGAFFKQTCCHKINNCLIGGNIFYCTKINARVIVIVT